MLLCQDRALHAGVGAAAPGILCARARMELEQQNDVSSPCAFTPFPWRRRRKSDNIRICKTVLKEKISEIISQSFTSPVGSINLSAVLGL